MFNTALGGKKEKKKRIQIIQKKKNLSFPPGVLSLLSRKPGMSTGCTRVNCRKIWVNGIATAASGKLEVQQEGVVALWMVITL